MLSPEQVDTLKAAEPEGANRVWNAMRLAGITQVQLAAGVGLTQPHISDLANGKYSALPLETARKLSDFFGCAIEDLFPPQPAQAKAS